MLQALFGVDGSKGGMQKKPVEGRDINMCKKWAKLYSDVDAKSLTQEDLRCVKIGFTLQWSAAAAAFLYC